MEVFGINGNGNGLQDNSGSELVGIRGRDIGVSRDFESSTVGSTASVNWLIRVGIFSGDSIGFDIFESLVHESLMVRFKSTSVASLVSLGS